MTQEEGLQWFTDEIAKCKTYIANKEFGDDVRTHQYGRLNGLWDAKNHFARFIAHNSLKTIEYPQPENIKP